MLLFKLLFPEIVFFHQFMQLTGSDASIMSGVLYLSLIAAQKLFQIAPLNILYPLIPLLREGKEMVRRHAC